MPRVQRDKDRASTGGALWGTRGVCWAGLCGCGWVWVWVQVSVWRVRVRVWVLVLLVWCGWVSLVWTLAKPGERALTQMPISREIDGSKGPRTRKRAGRLIPAPATPNKENVKPERANPSPSASRAHQDTCLSLAVKPCGAGEGDGCDGADGETQGKGVSAGTRGDAQNQQGVVWQHGLERKLRRGSHF